VGVAPNHFLAKIASDCQKPDGLTMVRPGEEEAFLNTIALGKIPGLGKKMQERLDELGILSTKQLRSYPKAELISLTGKGSGEFLWRAARGLESPDHGLPVKNHSLSAETTLREDTNNKDTLRKVLLDLSQQVMFRMLKGKWKGRTPFLKVRFEDFRTFTVQKTLAHYMTSGEELHQVMMAFLKEKWKGSPKIRLIGLGFHNIEKIDEYSQGELFEDDNTRRRQVEESVFRIKSRFPELPLMKASLLGRKNRSSPQDAGLREKEGIKEGGGGTSDAPQDKQTKGLIPDGSSPSQSTTKQEEKTRTTGSRGKKAAKATGRSREDRGKNA
jgi:DNA polymerase-4